MRYAVAGEPSGDDVAFHESVTPVASALNGASVGAAGGFDGIVVVVPEVDEAGHPRRTRVRIET